MSVEPPNLVVVSTHHKETYPFIDPATIAASQTRSRSVLVVGASKGIGLATAISYARAGFSRIALLARSDLSSAAAQLLSAAQEAKRPPPQILQLQANIVNADAVSTALAQVSEAFDGKLDVLVNNASRLGTWRPMAESDVDDWWATWEVNVKGVYLVTRAAMPLLLASALKTVVMVTSAGAFVEEPGASAYQSTKSAQIRLAEFLQTEYRAHGLLAYSVHPGSVKTETALTMPDYMHALLDESAESCGDTIVWLTKSRKEWLAARFVFGPQDMEQLESKRDEIVEKDLLRSRLVV